MLNFRRHPIPVESTVFSPTAVQHHPLARKKYRNREFLEKFTVLLRLLVLYKREILCPVGLSACVLVQTGRSTSRIRRTREGGVGRRGFRIVASKSVHNILNEEMTEIVIRFAPAAIVVSVRRKKGSGHGLCAGYAINHVKLVGTSNRVLLQPRGSITLPGRSRRDVSQNVFSSDGKKTLRTPRKGTIIHTILLAVRIDSIPPVDDVLGLGEPPPLAFTIPAPFVLHRTLARPYKPLEG